LTLEYLVAEGLTGKDLDFSKQLVEQTWTNRMHIDQLISGASEHWDLARLATIDRAILRLGVCELLFLNQSPPKVVINEAIEIAKKFGAAESPQFVNGILDAIWKKWEKENKELSPGTPGDKTKESIES